MLKNLRSKIFGGESEIININKSDFRVIQKNSMSYSRDRTSIAWHDKKLSRIQWEKGYITDENFFKTTKFDTKVPFCNQSITFNKP